MTCLTEPVSRRSYDKRIYCSVVLGKNTSMTRGGASAMGYPGLVSPWQRDKGMQKQVAMVTASGLSAAKRDLLCRAWRGAENHGRDLPNTASSMPIMLQGYHDDQMPSVQRGLRPPSNVSRDRSAHNAMRQPSRSRRHIARSRHARNAWA